MARRYYDWDATMSRQTGEQGEFCIVVGAKNIGKTFGLRKKCVERYIKYGERFCEICRTKDEKNSVAAGYFDKLKELNFFDGYIFKTTGNEGFIAREPSRDPETQEYTEKPAWQPICYFVALTMFQTEKKRTYNTIKRYIFDEAVIDRKDRYHSYLRSEYMVLANLLDTISRQQPGCDQYRVYLLGNACDLTCPYMRNLGINRPPEFGYSFWNRKNTLLHYVEPWDAEDMKTQTVVGRMLRGMAEADMVYGNVFNVDDTGDIEKKPSNARFAYAIRYTDNLFAIWLDYSQGLAYINSKVPKDAKPVFALTKADSTIDYQALERSSEYLKSLNRLWYAGLLRYESPVMREMFLSVLEFLGIR